MMSEPFDPYLQWLGIRDPHRPPNYYRLLGVELFESDPMVLTHAADRQMTHVRSFQTGPRTADSQRVLNEIAAAKVCLLNPHKREVYEAKLRAEMLQAGPLLASPAAPPVAPPVTPPAAPPVTVRPSAGLALASASISEPRGMPASLLIAVLAVAAAVLIGLIVFMAGGNSDDSGKNLASGEGGETSATEGTGENPAPPMPVGPQEPLTSRPGPEPGTTSAVKPTPSPGPHPKRKAGTTGPEAQPEKPALPKPPANADTAPRPTLKPETPEAKPKAEPGHGGETEPGKLPPTAKSGGKPAGPRPPLPDKAAQAEARREIRGVYKEDYAALQKPADKAVLADKLLREGIDTKDNPIYRYVLLAEARDLALASGDAALMRKAANAMGKSYEIEPLEELARILTEAAERPMPTPVRKNLARAALDLAEEAATQDAYDLSVRLAKVGHTLALKARDGITARQAMEFAESISSLKEQYAMAQQASKALQEDPENAKANLALGCYYALIKNDWERGPRLLAKGGNPKLKSLAEAELAAAGNLSPLEMVKLGEQWAAVADALDESYRPAVRRRALFWYDKALPELKGFTQARVTRLMQELKGAGGGRRRP